MSLLRVENLAIDVMRAKAPRRLVWDVSFAVDAGETIAIVGESGSGKSLSALATIGLLGDGLRLGGGRICFDGRDLAQLDERDMRLIRGREIAMIFQEPMSSLNPVRTIGSQLTEAMRLTLGVSRSRANDRALSLLEEVGISDPATRLKQYPHQLSGGMRQRVMIAIALACEPKVILADEPTTALDVTIQAQILDLISRLCRDHGLALVLITHNLGIVARYAKRVVVMYGGRVVEEASAAALYRRPMHPYTQGLLASVPRLDLSRDVKLRPINGAPPDPFELIDGCRFHPRCPVAIAQCLTQVPPLNEIGTRHIACWNHSKACQRPPVEAT